MKIIYDIGCLSLAIIASLVLFKELVGIGIGTIVGAFAFGPIIHLFQSIYDKIFIFYEPQKHKLRLRKKNGEPENDN